MWTRKLLKENAKIAFRRNYWTCVLVALLAGFLGGGSAGYTSSSSSESVSSSSSVDGTTLTEVLLNIEPWVWAVLIIGVLFGFIIGIMVVTFVSNVAMVGLSRYFIENREHKTSAGQFFYGFQGGRYLTIVKIMFLKQLYIWGWSLLFLIPGIVKTYSYMLVPYILAENPHMDRKRVFQLSSRMMKGHKMDAFVLELSFIGWNFLSALTMGILGIFYVNPYIYATNAEFYSAVKAEAMMKGLVMEGELPGVAEPTATI